MRPAVKDHAMFLTINKVNYVKIGITVLWKNHEVFQSRTPHMAISAVLTAVGWY